MKEELNIILVQKILIQKVIVLRNLKFYELSK